VSFHFVSLVRAGHGTHSVPVEGGKMVGCAQSQHAYETLWSNHSSSQSPQTTLNPAFKLCDLRGVTQPLWASWVIKWELLQALEADERIM